MPPAGGRGKGDILFREREYPPYTPKRTGGGGGPGAPPPRPPPRRVGGVGVGEAGEPPGRGFG